MSIPAYDMLRMQAYEAAALADLAATDIVHVPLGEYTQGSEHYERLMVQMENARRYSWPSSYEVNL